MGKPELVSETQLGGKIRPTWRGDAEDELLGLGLLLPLALVADALEPDAEAVPDPDAVKVTPAVSHWATANASDDKFSTIHIQ